MISRLLKWFDRIWLQSELERLHKVARDHMDAVSQINDRIADIRARLRECS